MHIRTELSGLGHYGVCTVLSRDALEESVETILKMKKEVRGGEWDNQNFIQNPYMRMGINSSLSIIHEYEGEDEEVRLSWIPTRLEEAMVSHSLLVRSHLIQQGKISPSETDDPVLELDCGRTHNGWFVKANLGTKIWEIIESEIFPQLRSDINDHLRRWWEDQTGSKISGQLTTLFSGRDGPTLQIYQPVGNGLWIVGSRQSEMNGYQLHDHNTDSARDAFSHVMGLCLVHAYCRNIVNMS